MSLLSLFFVFLLHHACAHERARVSKDPPFMPVCARAHVRVLRNQTLAFLNHLLKRDEMSTAVKYSPAPQAWPCDVRAHRQSLSQKKRERERQERHWHSFMELFGAERIETPVCVEKIETKTKTKKLTLIEKLLPGWCQVCALRCLPLRAFTRKCY